MRFWASSTKFNKCLSWPRFSQLKVSITQKLRGSFAILTKFRRTRGVDGRTFFRVTYSTGEIKVFFQFFSALWDFFSRNIFPQNVPISIYDVLQQWMLKHPRRSPLLARQIASTSGFFGYCKRIFDTLKSFCYSWATDMAPTYAVPGLFILWLHNYSLRGIGFLCKSSLCEDGSVRGSICNQHCSPGLIENDLWHFGFNTFVL